MLVERRLLCANVWAYYLPPQCLHTHAINWASELRVGLQAKTVTDSHMRDSRILEVARFINLWPALKPITSSHHVDIHPGRDKADCSTPSQVCRPNSPTQLTSSAHQTVSLQAVIAEGVAARHCTEWKRYAVRAAHGAWALWACCLCLVLGTHSSSALCCHTTPI